MGVLLSQQMAAWGVSMRGSINSRQRCPVCNRQGKFALRDYGRGLRALECECGQFVATRLYIRLRWRGKPYEIRIDENGRPLTTYAHAERALGAINNQIENTLDPTRTGPTFNPEFWVGRKAGGLVWENYLSAYLEAEKRRCTKATYQHKKALSKHLDWFNGRLIREIKTGDMEDFAAEPKLKETLSPKSRADLIAELGHILKRAEAREDIAKAPALPRVEVPRKPIKWMTAEQQAKALEHIPKEHRPIFFFMMQYGPRVAEACALCWDYVDTAKGEFYLARTYQRRSLAETTKTRRHNALPILGWFDEYLSGQPVGIGKTPVFQNPDANPRRNPARFYIPDFLRDTWKDVLIGAKLEPIHLKNATRHSVGNQRRREGWDEGLLARLLGHASTKHTRQYYVEDDTELLREKMKPKVRDIKSESESE